MSLDPFASIPEHPARPAEERPELERKGTKIPLTGEGVKKRRHHDYESDSRKMWRERGYLYDKCSYKQQYTNKSHDLFGFGDGIAIGNGELVIVQTQEDAVKDRGYTAWLVEKRDHPTMKPAYLALDDMLEIHWVPDADDAVHFARKADGDRMCENADLHDLAICEHSWPAGFPRDPVIPRWEGWKE